MYATSTLRPERILILVLEELELELIDPVASLLTEAHYIELVCLTLYQYKSLKNFLDLGINSKMLHRASKMPGPSILDARDC